MRHALFLDLEASCWPKGIPPQGEESEIIEIGYHVMDMANGGTVESGGFYVTPTVSSVSNYCEELTAITGELLHEKGIPFDNACLHMEKFRHLPWVSYGDDRDMFQGQCLKRGVRWPLSFEHYDASLMLNGGHKELIRLVAGQTKKIGLKDALHLFGLAFVGRQHSAVDDARNLARLVWHMAKGMDYETVAKISAAGGKPGVKP